MFGIIQEKIGKRISEGNGGNLFGGGQSGAKGAKPGTKRLPNQGCGGSGEDLQKTLSYEAQLDVAMVGIHFTTNGLAVRVGFHMQMLVSTGFWEGGHGGHPEVIGEGAHDA